LRLAQRRLEGTRVRGGAASLASNALRAALTALSGSGCTPSFAGGMRTSPFFTGSPSRKFTVTIWPSTRALMPTVR